MEELLIEIDIQKGKKYDLHIAMHKPFNFDRSPSDEEFLAMAGLAKELEKVERVISVLEEVRDAIISNRSDS